MGTHLWVLSESYLMSTHITGFRWLLKIFAFSMCFGESSLSIGRVKLNLMADWLSKIKLPWVKKVQRYKCTITLTLMVLVANFAIQNDTKTLKNDRNPSTMGTHLRVLSESYLMNIWQGFDGLQKSLHPCALDKSSLSIGSSKTK